MASRSHLQIFAPPQDWKTMALNLLMLDNAYSNSALVITPKLNLRQLSVCLSPSSPSAYRLIIPLGLQSMKLVI